MVSANNNLSEYDHSKAPGGKSIRIALVVSDWNQTVTDNLYQGARKTLLDHNVLAENIVKFDVPGSFELIYAASRVQTQKFDAIIVIGCIIQGETRHFEFISNASNLSKIEVYIEGTCILLSSSTIRSLVMIFRRRIFSLIAANDWFSILKFS